jgi:GTP-binding nuclear protein Ran
MSIVNQNRFKFLLIGDAGVGKSAYIRRVETGNFERNYYPTVGASVHCLRFDTNHGEFVCDVWDTAGQEKFNELKSSYYTDADAAVFFFDVHSRESYKSLQEWINDFKKVNSTAKCVIVGNKVDVPERKVKASKINLHDMKYFDLSSKSNYNFEKPFSTLLAQITGHEDLILCSKLED